MFIFIQLFILLLSNLKYILSNSATAKADIQTRICSKFLLWNTHVKVISI